MKKPSFSNCIISQFEAILEIEENPLEGKWIIYLQDVYNSKRAFPVERGHHSYKPKNIQIENSNDSYLILFVPKSLKFSF